MIHAYRWRLGLAKGELRCDVVERRPIIAVPTITIGSDFDGAAANGTPNRKQPSGNYSHRFFKGIGHNVPQEAPRKFAQAIMDVDRY